MDLKKNKIVIYTAIFGGYDDLVDPPKKFSGCDFICFTDRKDLKTNIWQIKVVENKENLSNSMLNRKYKMLPHLFLGDYEESIYIDGNIIIKKDPVQFKKKYVGSSDIILPFHFKRNCIYEEAFEVIKLGLCDKELVLKQIDCYKKKGFPKKYGLTENNVIYRKHMKSEVIKLMERWWEEYLRFPTRDQLSLMYVIWESYLLGIRINIKFIDNLRGTPFFYLVLHNKDKRGGLLGNICNKYIEYKINYPNAKMLNFFNKVINVFKTKSI